MRLKARKASARMDYVLKKRPHACGRFDGEMTKLIIVYVLSVPHFCRKAGRA